MSIWRTAEKILRPFDNEKREWIVRLRLWRGRRFGYHTKEYIGYSEGEDGEIELQLGPEQWHPPVKPFWWNRGR